MPLSTETLLVCFLGDPAAGSGDRPRVVVEGEGERIEEVLLSREARQFLRALALPADPSPPVSSSLGSANRLADVLASPPLQLRSADLEARLHLARSQTNRYRGQLRRELERQRLGGHLYSEARGLIGLRNAITDISTLFAAVRDERWEVTSRILTIVSPADPRAAQLLPDPGWGIEARAHIADALKQAKLNLLPMPTATEHALVLSSGDSPYDEDDEEVLEGEIVDEGPGAVVLSGPREVTIWPTRARLLRRGLWALLAILVVATAVTAARLLSDSPSPVSPLEISAENAGPWPENQRDSFETNTELANLTRAIPFGAPLIAKLGDTLLAGARIDVTRDSPYRQQPFELGTSIEPGGLHETGVNIDFSGPNLPHDGGSGFTVSGITPSERLQLVRGSTLLLDEHDRVIEHLPDMRLDNPYYLHHLKVGRLYYVEWRLQVVEAPTSAGGQLSHVEGIECAHPHQSPPFNTEAEIGDVLGCTLNLVNWGATTIHDLQIHLSWNTVRSPDQLNIFSSASSNQTSPRVAHFANGFVNLIPLGTRATFAYVPGSSKLATSKGKILAGLADPSNGKITIPTLNPGLTGARQLIVELRVVQPRKTRSKASSAHSET